MSAGSGAERHPAFVLMVEEKPQTSNLSQPVFEPGPAHFAYHRTPVVEEGSKRCFRFLIVDPKWRAKMEHRKLISFVENYEELYNLRHPHYSNQLVRNKNWDKIANAMKIPDLSYCEDRLTIGVVFHKKGKGVVTYSEDPKNNSWISNRRGISTSEWTNSIKMSTNIAAVRSVPGRSFQDQNCRNLNAGKYKPLDMFRLEVLDLQNDDFLKAECEALLGVKFFKDVQYYISTA
ncbi:hypothetical protein ANN_14203 [Periplaneta americana]|uniref:MADF domain-containing protein n=1 Tax=Periplaneta americana TaxID=6978 RepID=A0ABQ8SVN4_PERAM|nr:hypothetical protein ANN_14203 [Periplaneta americana]